MISPDQLSNSQCLNIAVISLSEGRTTSTSNAGDKKRISFEMKKLKISKTSFPAVSRSCGSSSETIPVCIDNNVYRNH